MPEFTSVYRGVIYDLSDPTHQGRARLQVPSVLGAALSGWATPLLGGQATEDAVVNSPTWVLFENGDINRPTWVPAISQKAAAFYQEDPPAKAKKGDLWYDTTDGRNIPHYLASVNPVSWLPLRDGAIQVLDAAVTAAAEAAATANSAAIAAQSVADIALSLADGATVTYFGDAFPWPNTSGQDSAKEGDLFFHELTRTVWRWDHNTQTWTEFKDPEVLAALSAAANAQASADGKITAYYDDTAPAVGSEGDLWYDTNDKNQPYYCSSEDPLIWTPIRDGLIQDAIFAAVTADGKAVAAQSDADTALANAATAQAAADGKVRSFFEDVEPTGLTASDVGDMWFDTNNGNLLHRWSGTAWLVAQDQGIVSAISKADMAQETADGKITTFYHNDPPVSEGVGDLWIDLNDNNHLYRAESAGATIVAAGQWVSVRDKTIAAVSTAASEANTKALEALSAAAAAQAVADGSIRTYYADTAPWANGTTQPDNVVGDMWFRTSTAVAYRWTGSTWDIIPDTAISQALAAAMSAQTTADGKINAYYWPSAPTTNGTGQPLSQADAGDIWYDTTAGMGNRASYWDGDSWELIQFGSAALASNAVTLAKLDLTSVTARALGSITTFTGTGTPASPREGDMWLHGPQTLNGVANKYILKRWNGTAWVEASDPKVEQALSDALAASNTADSKMAIYWSHTPPTENTQGAVLGLTDAGDIWFETDNGLKPWRWDGDSWEPMTIGLGALDAAVTARNLGGLGVTTSNTAPTNPRTGDQWVHGPQTINGVGGKYILKTWDGTAWVESGDSKTEQALLEAKKLASRGTDLVTNGSGLMFDNTNFSSFVFTPGDAPTGSVGSFYTPSTSQMSIFIDDVLPFDPTKKYRFSFKVRQTVAGATNRAYGFLAPYDSHGMAISPTHYMFNANTTTTLAQALNPGDTTIRLTSAANWWGSAAKPAGNAGHQRTIIFWNYTDPSGKVWPAHTYSRNTGLNAWADGGVNTTTNTITLSAPWAGGAFPVGHPVSNGSSGGTYIYTPSLQNHVVPETWTEYSDVFDAGAAPDVTAALGRSSTTWDTGVPPGTASVKIGWLLNYPASPANPTAGRHGLAAVSLSDAGAAQTLALTALNSANGKNKVTYSLSSPPTGVANALGDVWFQRDASGNILGQWEGMGDGTWASRALTHQVIASIDVGKGVVGVLSADHVDAEAITADFTLTDQMTVTGTINVGTATWSQADGLNFPGVMVIPSDPTKNPFFYGDMTAKSLTVEQGFNMLGTTNKVSGELRMSNGVTRPTGTPSLIAGWPFMQTGEGQTFGPIHYGLTTHHSDANLLVTAICFYGTTIRAVSKTNGQGWLLYTETKPWGVTGPTGFNALGGVVRIGTDYYVLGVDSARASADNKYWFVYKLNSTFDKVGEVGIWLPDVGRPTIGTDGTNILVAQSYQDRVWVATFNTSLSPAFLARSIDNLPHLGSAPLAYIGIGNFDFGVQKTVISVAGNANFVFAGNGSTGDRQGDQYAFRPANDGEVRGLVWVDGRFKSFDKAGKLHDHGKFIANTNITGTYTWADRDAGGTGVHETEPSQVASLTVPARAWWSMQAGTPPDSGVVGGNADKANQVGFYVGSGAGTRMWQGYGGLSGSSAITARAGDSVATSVLVEPVSNGFLGSQSSPGILASAREDGSGPLTVLRGDGTARINGQQIEDTGWLTPTLTANWTHYDTTTYGPVRYKRKNGIVYISGLVKTTAANVNNSIIFNIPAGFRPRVDALFAVTAGAAAHNLYIERNGNLHVPGWAPNQPGGSYLSVTVSYPADN